MPLADVTLLRHCQDRKHSRLKFFLGETMFIEESWGLIMANLLNSSKKIIPKNIPQKIYRVSEMFDVHSL
jgi:hypothetical protein